MEFKLIKRLEKVTITDKKTKEEKEITITHFFLRQDGQKDIPIMPYKKEYKNGSRFSNSDILGYLADLVD